MIRRGSALTAGAALMLILTGRLGAQDSLPLPPPVLRHILGVNFARVAPFHRVYDINVLAGDAVTNVGHRDVSLSETLLADSTPGWLLTESRDGLAPAADSLWLAQDLRPTHWTATSAVARLDIAFDSDSLRGLAKSARSNARVVAAIPPDVVPSGAMLELMIGLVPMQSAWSDSVHVLTTTLAGAQVAGAELIVMGEDSVATMGAPTRHLWVVGLNADSRRLVMWVDRDSGAVIRSQQTVPHSDTLLEYRERITAPVALPPQ